MKSPEPVGNVRDQIVFLDAGTVNYGDISFAELEALGEFRAYEKTRYEEITARVGLATAVITNKCLLDSSLLSRLIRLRSIHVAATGVNNIDRRAASRKGIAVTNVAGYSTESVVQCTFAFILALAGQLVKFNEGVHRGDWSRSDFFVWPAFPVTEIRGKTLGILGYGTIGRRVAQVARAFGMKILVGKIPGRAYAARGRVKRVGLDQVLGRSDFLTIHTPLSDLTHNLIRGKEIRKMKQGAFLINMARGGIVDETALRKALEAGRLAGAAADVLTQEPPHPDHVLIGAPNLLLTPHIAWASREARIRLVHEVALNIRAFQTGKRRNRVE